MTEAHAEGGVDAHSDSGGAESTPSDIDSLNRQFYQEHGPPGYLHMRLRTLCVVGGAYDQFKGILADGIEVADFSMKLSTADGDCDAAVKSDMAFREKYMSIEAHHLKHLAAETLIRLFLGHRGFPHCPWWEISRETNFATFKEIVNDQILRPAGQKLMSDVADVLLGLPTDPSSLSEEQLDVVDNLASFLRVFAREWLDESKSYNATKHGLTAVPCETALAVGTDDSRMVAMGSGESLTHLTHKQWQNGEREWHLATRWIRLQQALVATDLICRMLASLWSVARARYGITDHYQRFMLPSSTFSTRELQQMGTRGAREMSWYQFTEMKRH